MRVSGALRHIEHIATLRLAPHVAVPEMLRALDGLVPGARSGFFWVDGGGAVLDAWLPGVDPVPRGPEGGGTGALLRCDREGGVELNVRVGDRLCAVLAVRRPQLGERDRRLLRAVAPAFSRALAAVPRPAGAIDDVPDRTGVLIADAEGRLISAGPGALRLLAEMDGRPLVTDAPDPAPGDRLPPFAADLVRAAARASVATLQKLSRWGAYRAQAFAQGGPGAAVAVVIAKHLPGAVRLVRRLEALDLSPRERQVAFQLGLGVDAAEGARALGVSAATWRSYVKRVYQRLEVSDRVELFARLNGRPIGEGRPDAD